MKYPLLNELYEKYGDDLLKEVASVVDENGQGDCYKVKCEKYCGCGSCIDAIKTVCFEIIRGESDEHTNQIL